ncbi:nuclear transport factor 2 family protein [Arenimonas sp.]|uniref:YybH family protein n=1 Tax=Arenimonas sp. TaxID=1872635 RepID=UPI0025C56A39|nr:nuclear transport factor 2 family protein [Arenimonas sp.]
MKRIATLAVFSLAAVGSPAFADGPTTPPHTHDATTHAPAGPELGIPAQAMPAVAVVERFSAALAAGQLDAAGAELDPNVLILESGGAERSAAEYLGGHAKGDAAFLQTAHIQLLRRTAQVSGDLAWVASESELHLSKDGKPVTVLSTETMLVQRSDAGWKIVHIHWSSRTKAPGDHH